MNKADKCIVIVLILRFLLTLDMYLVSKLQATQFCYEYKALSHEFHLFTGPQTDSRASNPIIRLGTICIYTKLKLGHVVSNITPQGQSTTRVFLGIGIVLQSALGGHCHKGAV